MIIAISGKIGSGKDTVGKIIQYLTSQEYQRKITVDREIVESFKDKDFGDYLDRHTTINWQIKKFADKLKEICSLLTGIPRADFEKQEVKDSLLGEEWARNHKFSHPGKTILDSDYVQYSREIPTVRWLLQTVGTEAMRNHVHENVWVNALFADYKIVTKHQVEGEAEWNEEKKVYIVEKVPHKELEHLIGKEIKEPKFGMTTKWRSYLPNPKDVEPNWVITDMRFPNELKAVKDRDGITIRLQRKTDTNDGHPSETALDTAHFDYIIDNDGTIEELVEKVKEVLTKEKVI